VSVVLSNSTGILRIPAGLPFQLSELQKKQLEALRHSLNSEIEPLRGAERGRPLGRSNLGNLHL
jgi:hypothetical protein